MPNPNPLPAMLEYTGLPLAKAPLTGPITPAKLIETLQGSKKAYSRTLNHHTRQFLANRYNYPQEDQLAVYTAIGQAATVPGQTFNITTTNQKRALVWLTNAAHEISEIFNKPTVYPFVARYVRIHEQKHLVEVNGAQHVQTMFVHGRTFLHYGRVITKETDLDIAPIMRYPGLLSEIKVCDHHPNLIHLLTTLAHEVAHLAEKGTPDHGDKFTRIMADMGIIYNYERREHHITRAFFDVCVAIINKLGPFPGTYRLNPRLEQLFYASYPADPGICLAPYTLRVRRVDSASQPSADEATQPTPEPPTPPSMPPEIVNFVDAIERIEKLT